MNKYSNETKSCFQVLKRMIKCCSMMNCHTQVPDFHSESHLSQMRYYPKTSTYEWMLFAAVFRLQFSASFSARLITWRLSKLFKNRTGLVHAWASVLDNIHIYFRFTSSNLISVMMPWTPSMTTSGTWQFWNILLVSLGEKKIISPWRRIVDSMHKSNVWTLFLNCVQIFTTNEEKLRRDKLL